MLYMMLCLASYYHNKHTSPADWINDSHYELVYYQEVALKSQPGCQSFSPPQYYSQLITEMEILGWDKYDDF